MYAKAVHRSAANPTREGQPLGNIERTSAGRHEKATGRRVRTAQCDRPRSRRRLHRCARALIAISGRMVSNRAGGGCMGLPSDIRISIRTLTKHRTFTIAAVLTVAIGVGATTAIATIVDSILLRPLPYSDSERIVQVISYR